MLFPLMFLALVLPFRCNAESKPQILNSTFVIKIEQDDELAHLKCIVQGNPQPLVTWYKDSKIVNDANGVKLLTTNCTNFESHLIVATVNSKIDSWAGNYTCTAKNNQGEAKQIFQVKSIRTLKAAEQPTEDTLSNQAITAIAAGLGLGTFFAVFTAIFICRRQKILNKAKRRQAIREHSEAHENMSEEIQEIGENHTHF